MHDADSMPTPLQRVLFSCSAAPPADADSVARESLAKPEFESAPDAVIEH
jgi:hypothetical protein